MDLIRGFNSLLLWMVNLLYHVTSAIETKWGSCQPLRARHMHFTLTLLLPNKISPELTPGTLPRRSVTIFISRKLHCSLNNWHNYTLFYACTYTICDRKCLVSELIKLFLLFLHNFKKLFIASAVLTLKRQ